MKSESYNLTKEASTNSSIVPLQTLLNKDLTRSQFLKVTFLGLLSILGLSTIIHFFTGKHPSTHIAAIAKPPHITKYGHKVSK